MDLVGHKGGGKTSLLNRLTGNPFFDIIDSTEGINIKVTSSTFDANDETEAWEESSPDEVIDFKDFNQVVTSKARILLAEADTPMETSESVSQHQTSDRNIHGEESSMPSTKSIEMEVDENPVPTVEKEEPIKIVEAYDTSRPNEDHSNEPARKICKLMENLSSPSKSTSSSSLSTGQGFVMKRPPKMNQQLQKRLSLQLQKTPNQDNQDYSVSLWDFGGQDEFIVTHQLFLHGESLALLVMDMSIGLHDELPDSTEATSRVRIPRSPAGFLHFWLDTIYKKATEKSLEPNVALVLTHRDLIEEREAENYIKSYKTEITKSLQGKAYSSYITENNIYITDNKNGTAGDFYQLRKQFFQRMKMQRSWGMERPVKWLKLEADMKERAKKKNVKYLDLYIVEELASMYMMNSSDIRAFLKFHHTMGDFVYYPEVNDVVIIDPQWLINAFKALITNHMFLERRPLQHDVVEEVVHGMISQRTLELLWNGSDIDILVHIMKRLNLIMPLLLSDNRKIAYLIPMMLPKTELKMYQEEPSEGMIMVYISSYEAFQAEYIPIGTFHKLLSSCGNEPKWKILQKYLSYTYASFSVHEGIIVALTLLERKIKITVWSEPKLEYDDRQSSICFIRDTLNGQLSTLEIEESKTFEIMCPKPTDDECLVRIEVETSSSGHAAEFVPQHDKCYQHSQPISTADYEWLHPKLDKIAHMISMIPLEERADIIEVIEGKAQTIEGPNSDVKLETPKGAYGVVFGMVHTNHHQFLHLIPDSDCLICQVCEYGFHPDKKKHSPEGMFKVLIPYTVKDIEKVKGDIRVRQVSSKDGRELTTDILSACNTEEADAYWKVEDKYICIFTKHFCMFIVTAEAINCCAQSAELLLFGSLKKLQVPTLTITTYLGSHLYQAYIQVDIFQLCI